LSPGFAVIYASALSDRIAPPNPELNVQTIESLEVRRLLSYTLNATTRTLTVTGTTLGDTISFAPTTGDVTSYLLTFNGAVTKFKRSAIQTVVINGGLGNDRLTVAQSFTGVLNESLNGGVGDDRLQLGNTGGDAHGGAGNDTVLGGNGVGENLYGDEGNDSVIGGAAESHVDGGPGADVLGDTGDADGSLLDHLDYSGRTASVNITDDGIANDGEATEGDNVQGGFEFINGGAGNDTITVGTASTVNFLNISGNGGNDTITVKSGPAVLSGNDGNDRLVSSPEGFANSLYGGNGSDTFKGGTGPDTFEGDAGTDTVDYSASTAGVTVRLDGINNDGRTGEHDNVLADVENVSGSAFNDLMVGSAAANVFAGGRGNDTLMGMGGNDVLYGGDGNDFLWGGDGNDLLDAGTGLDVLHGDAGDDTLRAADGVGGDVLDGGVGFDRAHGDAADPRTSIEAII
jgi:Ca2+-binding RTX toxin-like protein